MQHGEPSRSACVGGRLMRAERGQTMVEKLLLFTVVAAALVAMFTYVQSSVASRMKNGADAFGHGLLHDGN